MRIIIFLISLLILCCVKLTNCQLPIPAFPTSSLTSPTESLTPQTDPATFTNNPIPPANEPAFSSPSAPSTVIVLSTTTQHVGPAVTTLSPTVTVVAYVTVGKKSSCNKILLNLWNIGIFNIISTIALWFT
jgi:hypothetical protein